MAETYQSRRSKSREASRGRVDVDMMPDIRRTHRACSCSRIRRTASRYPAKVRSRTRTEVSFVASRAHPAPKSRSRVDVRARLALSLDSPDRITLPHPRQCVRQGSRRGRRLAERGVRTVSGRFTFRALEWAPPLSADTPRLASTRCRADSAPTNAIDWSRGRIEVAAADSASRDEAPSRFPGGNS